MPARRPSTARKHDGEFSELGDSRRSRKKSRWLIKPFCPVDVIALPWRLVGYEHQRAAAPAMF